MNIDIPIMNSYFDESVFLDGWIFKRPRNVHPVSVFNRADSFILKNVHGVSTIETCQIGNNNYSLNPINPCARINVYSLDNRHSSTYNLYTHKIINVIHDSAASNERLRIINLDVLNEIENYEILDSNPDLTSLESAIMLKFYSLQIANNDIYKSRQSLNITATLYHKVSLWFEFDSRQWFAFDRTNLLVRSFNGEYVYKNKIINDPIELPRTFYDTPL